MKMLSAQIGLFINVNIKRVRAFIEIYMFSRLCINKRDRADIKVLPGRTPFFDLTNPNIILKH